MQQGKHLNKLGTIVMEEFNKNMFLKLRSVFYYLLVFDPIYFKAYGKYPRQDTVLIAQA